MFLQCTVSFINFVFILQNLKYIVVRHSTQLRSFTCDGDVYGKPTVSFLFYMQHSVNYTLLPIFSFY